MTLAGTSDVATPDLKLEQKRDSRSRHRLLQLKWERQNQRFDQQLSTLSPAVGLSRNSHSTVASRSNIIT